MTVARPIFVLYEDQRGPVRYFGPHELVVSCVSDQVGRVRDEVRQRLIGIAKKDDSKLLRACRSDVQIIGKQGGPVVAVFDDDRVRRLPELSSQQSKREVAAQITSLSQSNQLIVWMLVKNMESVSDACAVAVGKPVPKSKPNPAQRDRLLSPVAWGRPSQRTAVRSAVPTFDCLIHGLARLWACP